MSKENIALIVGAVAVAAVLISFIRTQRAAAARLKARGGREIDVSNLIAFGSKAGEGEITHR
jgi:predicted lysophospholipase L1 biosynthesis ABC-type transport system permease subunit